MGISYSFKTQKCLHARALPALIMQDIGRTCIRNMADLFVSHQKFFDQLVELIPAKYYRAGDQEHVELRFLPKQQKAAAKQDFKKQAKANKRRKLDPDAGEGGSSSDEGEEEGEAQPGPGSSAQTAANLGSSSNCSRAELQARLHKKIEVGNWRR